MEKLTREEVLHVAELARIKLSEEEIEKLNEVKGYDDEILISCWEENTKLRKDEKGEMLNPKEVLENVPRHSGNYIAVPVVISGGEGA